MPHRAPRASQRASQNGDPSSQESDREIEPDNDDRDESLLQREARNIVRLALFAESRRTTLRRDEIVKKALSNPRLFNQAYLRAQGILNDVFGMELVEVMSKAERDAHDKPPEGETSKKKGPATSKAYVLRSTLDPLLIEAANAFDEDILLEESNQPQAQSRDHDEDIEYASGGCILAWQISDRLGSMGLLAVILALILVNGRELTDVQLRGHLKTLHLPPNVKLPFKTQTVESLSNTVSTETFLANMVKQGYLDKIKAIAPAPSGSQAPNKPSNSKRPRNTHANAQEKNDAFNWRWGARALAELGEKAIVEFLTSFMVDKKELIGEDEEDEEGGTPGNVARYRERRKEEAENMRKSIIKAAGTLMKE